MIATTITLGILIWIVVAAICAVQHAEGVRPRRPA